MDPVRLVVKHTFLEVEASGEQTAVDIADAINHQTDDAKTECAQNYRLRRSTVPALGTERTTSSGLPLLPMVVSLTPDTRAGSSHESDTSEEDDEPTCLESIKRHSNIQTRRCSMEIQGRRASVETMGRRASVETTGRRASVETTGRRASVETDRRISVISTVTDLDGDHAHSPMGLFRLGFGGLDAPPWGASGLPPPQPPSPPLQPAAQTPPQGPQKQPPGPAQAAAQAAFPTPGIPPYSPYHPSYNQLLHSYAAALAAAPGYYNAAAAAWPWAAWANAGPNFCAAGSQRLPAAAAAVAAAAATTLPQYNMANMGIPLGAEGCNGHAAFGGFGCFGGFPSGSPPSFGGSHGPAGPEPGMAEENDNRTTVMLRNLPEGFTRDAVIRLFDQVGFAKLYDFVYMPMNFRTKASFGYAFVNMPVASDAQRCHDFFQGFSQWGVATEKVCEVSWSDMHQGLAAHIERYRNSPIMHETVPDEYKPAMFTQGVRVPFPPPTKKLRVPRVRRAVDGGDTFADGEEDGTPTSPSAANSPSSYFSAGGLPRYHPCSNLLPGSLAVAA